ncbi:hypothetical protein KGY72_07825 [Candidatus Bipolaricaulota bacterium]|nr:hypothetical protein [Candidatus Bipolaricaulota bacterium]
MRILVKLARIGLLSIGILVIVCVVAAPGTVELNKPEWQQKVLTSGTIVTAERMVESLKSVAPDLDTVKVFDRQYRVLGTKQLLYDVMGKSPTDSLTFQPENFDCDHFARLFSSLVMVRWGLNSVGTVYNDSHAFNIAPVNKSGELTWYVISPQRKEEYLWKLGSKDLDTFAFSAFDLKDALIVF